MHVNFISKNSYFCDTNKEKSNRKMCFVKRQNFPQENITSNQETDSVKTVPILVYQSKNELEKESEKKLGSWLEQRLSKKPIQLYRQKTEETPQIKK